MSWENNFKQYDTSTGYGNPKEWKQSFYQRMSQEEAFIIVEKSQETPYQILGITTKATQKEIKSAFRKKITEWHPDLNQHRIQEATIMSQKIIAAYTLLIKK